MFLLATLECLEIHFAGPEGWVSYPLPLASIAMAATCRGSFGIPLAWLATRFGS